MDYYNSSTNSMYNLNSPMAVVMSLVYCAFVIALTIASWKVFTKAGQAGWKVLIPVYNLYIVLKIIGRSGWWILGLMVPVLGFIMSIIFAIEFGKSFGWRASHSIILLWLIAPVGILILGFGQDKYLGPNGHTITSESNSSLNI